MSNENEMCALSDYSDYFDGQTSQSYKLNVGDIQSLVFTEMDNGPFHLTMTERMNQKYDKITGEMVIKKKNLRELMSELAAARGHIDVNLIKGNRERNCASFLECRYCTREDRQQFYQRLTWPIKRHVTGGL